MLISSSYADIIEACGGSARLLRILNWLGVYFSADTHARYVQYRVQKRKEEGPMNPYPTNTLTVFSIDNVDYIHSYARVYCGKQMSSWHGTTIQVVQPQPSHLVDKKEVFLTRQMATQAESTANSDVQENQVRHPDTPATGTVHFRLKTCLAKRSHSACSPSNRPGKRSPLPKRQRRMRTGTETKCGSIHDQSANATNRYH